MFDEINEVARTFTRSKQCKTFVVHRGINAVVVGDGYLIGVRFFHREFLDSLTRQRLTRAPGSLTKVSQLG